MSADWSSMTDGKTLENESVSAIALRVQSAVYCLGVARIGW